MLGAVEDMGRRLLTEEEVDAVMQTCRRVARTRVKAAAVVPAPRVSDRSVVVDSTSPRGRWRTSYATC